MPQFGHVIDSRDGKSYRTVLMPDGRWWMERMAYASADSRAPNGNAGNVADYGRIYRQADAIANAVPGCVVPTRAQIDTLFASVGGYTASAAYALCDAGFFPPPADNSTGFSARPAGRCNVGNVYQWFDETFVMMSATGGPLSYGMFVAFLDAVTDASWSAGTGNDWVSVHLIVESGNIPDGPTIYGAAFDGFERDASVRIERNIRWVDSVGGGVQGIPTMGASLDTWQISASLRVSHARAAAIEAAVGPYIGQVAPSLALPHRMGENSFPGLVPSTIDESGDVYVNPCIQGAGFRSNGRVAVVTDLFDYGLDYDLTACPTGGDANGATTPITTAPDWLAGKFAQHSITDTSNERRAIKSDGYFNPLLYSAKHGRRFDYTIHLDLLSQAQADELVAYFRGVRHEAYTVTLEFGTEGFASKAAHFRELSFQRNGIHWDGELQITLARS